MKTVNIILAASLLATAGGAIAGNATPVTMVHSYCPKMIEIVPAGNATVKSNTIWQKDFFTYEISNFSPAANMLDWQSSGNGYFGFLDQGGTLNLGQKTQLVFAQAQVGQDPSYVRECYYTEPSNRSVFVELFLNSKAYKVVTAGK